METAEAIKTTVESHYTRPNLYESIEERLRDAGVELEKVSRGDIAGVDEFHVRGAEVSKEIAREIGINSARVLDIGCGIGGPARMLADEFECRVTGIDINAEFIRTANKLSELVGLNDKTEFLQADALNLPFPDKIFDVVWTQHVQMNISDKERFYAEIARVLSDEGTFVYYDIFRKGTEDVIYPVPWADDASISFLQTTSNLDTLLNKLGLNRISTTDQTAKAIDFFDNMFEKVRKSGLPKMNLDLIVGSSFQEKFGNVLKSLKENRIELQSGTYKKK